MNAPTPAGAPPAGAPPAGGPPPVPNPYVGPRTFTSEQSHLFFGRDREARDLLARVLSERLVLFYAQSGAGKSSLINTRLAPGLREVGYAVLPVARVGGEAPAGTGEVQNIFLFNLMLGLLDPSPPPSRLANLSFGDFLDALSTVDGEHYTLEEPAGHAAAPGGPPGPEDAGVSSQPYVLIIDQFEELVTTHPDRWHERAEFFHQLDEAMRHDPNLWVVLSMREDFVAPIEPYAPLLADRMRARFYMERMGLEAALNAIRRPAELGGRPFAAGVAEQLVEDLRQVRVPGQEATIAGQYVEPVQLQVVCQQLWENIKARPLGPISAEDLQEAGDVDRALIQFYEETLRAALAAAPEGTAGGVSERRLRNWFDKELITPAGTRGLVRQGDATTGSLPNVMVGALQKRFLVRAEARSGDTWIELVHDRFVEPIRESNRAWFAHKEDPLSQAARDWEQAGRTSQSLYTGSQLASASALLQAAPQEYGELEQGFIEASQKREDRRTSSRQRWIATAAFVLALLFIVLAALAFGGQRRAESEATRAKVAEADAVQQAKDAQIARDAASTAQADAEGLAQQAQDAADTAIFLQGRERNARAEAEANAADALAAKAAAEAALQAQQQALVEQSDTLHKSLTALAMALVTPTDTPTPPATAATSTPVPTSRGTPAPSPAATAVPIVKPTLVRQPTVNALVIAQKTQVAQLAQVQATQTALARPAGRLVFVSSRASKADLYTVNLNGSAPAQLTTQGGWEPSYARAAGQIVYTSDGGRPDRALLFTIPAVRGGQPSGLGGDTYDNWEPDYSPDGSRVAFTTSRDNDWEIYVMNSDGSGQTRLTNSPEKDEAAAWSPDGQRIAFSSERNGQVKTPKIWVMNADGSNARALTTGKSIDVYPTWSPDGKQIAFASDRGGGLDIWVMTVDSRNLRNVTRSPEDENYPDWSPDGNWIACTRFTTNTEIFIVSIDGGTAINVTNNPASDWQPAWIDTLPRLITVPVDG